MIASRMTSGLPRTTWEMAAAMRAPTCRTDSMSATPCGAAGRCGPEPSVRSRSTRCVTLYSSRRTYRATTASHRAAAEQSASRSPRTRLGLRQRRSRMPVPTRSSRIMTTMTTTPEFTERPLWDRIRGAGLVLIRQLAKFGVVGGVAYVVDLTVFNLLLFAGPAPLLAGQPLLAKVVSTTAATVVAWLGNRYWTFRHNRRPDVTREFVLYLIMCTIGLLISLTCLWVAHYVLGFTSVLADNVAANVVGLAAGTAFRFWAYKRFVFTHQAEP